MIYTCIAAMHPARHMQHILILPLRQCIIIGIADTRIIEALIKNAIVECMRDLVEKSCRIVS